MDYVIIKVINLIIITIKNYIKKRMIIRMLSVCMFLT